jgi:ribosome-associated protein
MLLTDEQRHLISQKLNNRINSEGVMVVRSQTHRTQLANKEEVIQKINALIFDALKKKKARIATRVSKAAKERRIESKKKLSEIKSGRKRLRPRDL